VSHQQREAVSDRRPVQKLVKVEDIATRTHLSAKEYPQVDISYE
jgi:hypothetical protein